MKMSDVFDGDIVDVNLFQDSCYLDTDNADYEIEDGEVKERVIYAINNHDRMAGEIAALKGALIDMVDGYDRYDLVCHTGLSQDRCQEIIDLAINK